MCSYLEQDGGRVPDRFMDFITILIVGSYGYYNLTPKGCVSGISRKTPFSVPRNKLLTCPINYPRFRSNN